MSIVQISLYERLTTHLATIGFRASTTDPSMFVWFYGRTFIILILYVDDIITNGNHPTSLQLLIRQLASAFAMKDLGPLHYFLGLEVHRSSEGLFLSQTKYAQLVVVN